MAGSYVVYKQFAHVSKKISYVSHHNISTMQSESFMSTRLTNVPSSVGLSSSGSDCCIVEEACCGVSRAESTFQIGLGNHGCCVLQAKEVMD